MTHRDGREARDSLPVTLRARSAKKPIALVIVALWIGGCAQSGGQPTGPSSATAPSACLSAFAAASSESDPETTAEALDAALRACETADEWTAAGERHAADLDGIDPQQFLADRCLNGPPDIAETTLCRSVEVDR